jgi:MraZ protein
VVSRKEFEQPPIAEEVAFRGVFQHSLDEKGRVSFPAEFRQALQASGDESVVLTNFLSDGARCLEGYSLTSWKRFEQKLRQRSRFDPQVRKLENFYLSRSQVVLLDANGRVNIPPHLRTYAGLERDVVFSSSVHGFRIWDKRVWDLVFQEAEAALLENPALFLDVDR